MNLKAILAKPFATYIYKIICKERLTAVANQQEIFTTILKKATKTTFGQDHNFAKIKTYDDYKQAIPIRDYEQLKPYIDSIKAGKQHILWPGLPIYFAKTSGTTSGTKYIPITKDSIKNHITTARNALLCYIAQTGNNNFVAGKMIFLSGSPELERVGNVPYGRLSGIVNHHVPKYLRSNQLPTYTTNCIEDWETKVDAIVKETINQDMTLISGIPPWMQMYFDKLVAQSGKKIGELFPNFNLMVQGGVNFEPYSQKLYDTIGRKVDCIELFPASEGFFAYQDTLTEKGMLLNTNSGIYYEFVPAAEIQRENPTRLNLSQVQLNQNYALIISSNAGLWAYNIGDTIKFVSLNPYRLVVTGRIKHFISAFGEHVIGEEVEQAMLYALAETSSTIIEFTVAPYIGTAGQNSYHQWFVSFDKAPSNMNTFAEILNLRMQQLNTYYNDLITGNILQPLKLIVLPHTAFIQYMKSIGKLGGQNKTPRLSNDRAIASELEKYIE